MKQRGRRSAASLQVVTAAGEQNHRQRPPGELSREQAAVWSAIVRAEPADWFSASTRPVLVQYCRHIVAARRAAEMIEALEASIAERAAVNGANPLTITLSASEEFDRLLKMQERESRVIASLATKMRITQQATTNHRGNRIESKKPWEF
jgi:hypothetical protein